jgi:hypothetical protein
MRKLITAAVLAAVIPAASSSAVASAEPMAPDYSGTYVYTPSVESGHPAGGGVYSARLHNVAPDTSVMTMGNGCVQEWHDDQDMGQVAGALRSFFWSHVTSGESLSCRDSSRLGVTITTNNDRKHITVIDQQSHVGIWEIDQVG